MKVVVLYQSRTGFAKKYAQWISEELSADIFELSNISINKLESYDTIIYGGSLYAGGINGLKLIKQNLEKLKGKRIVIFATGMSPSREEIIKEVKTKNLTIDEQRQIEFFYLRGGFDFSKLKTSDKILMTMLKWKIKLKKEEELTSDEKGMLDSYKNPVDFTSKKNIDKIITYVNS